MFDVLPPFSFLYRFTDLSLSAYAHFAMKFVPLSLVLITRSCIYFPSRLFPFLRDGQYENLETACVLRCG